MPTCVGPSQFEAGFAAPKRLSLNETAGVVVVKLVDDDDAATLADGAIGVFDGGGFCFLFSSCSFLY